jgi:anti-sigma factor RsiW
VSYVHRLAAPWRRFVGRRRRAAEPPGGGLACRELVELVTAYLEGALSGHDQRRFDAHLAVCPGCREYLEQMRQTIAAVGRLAASDLDPMMRDRLLAAFRTWRSSDPSPQPEAE